MDDKEGRQRKPDADAAQKDKPAKPKHGFPIIDVIHHSTPTEKIATALWALAVLTIGEIYVAWVWNSVEKPKIIIILGAVSLTFLVWVAAFRLWRIANGQQPAGEPAGLNNDAQRPKEHRNLPATVPTVTAPSTTSPATTQISSEGPIPPPEVLPDGRIVIRASPKYLMGLCSQHLSIHAKKLTEPFEGKWIRVSGSVADIKIYSSEIEVVLKCLPEAYAIQAEFKPKWRDRLDLLSRNMHIEVFGQIDEILSNMLFLKNSELVSSA